MPQDFLSCHLDSLVSLLEHTDSLVSHQRALDSTLDTLTS